MRRDPVRAPTAVGSRPDLRAEAVVPIVGSMRLAGPLLLIVLIAGACSSDPEARTTPTQEPAPSTTESTAAAQATQTVPDLLPGSRTFGKVTVDDVPIDYIALVPEGFTAGDTAPVLLALPPGGQDIGLATGTIRDIYQTEALARGWVVVSPAAPEGALFFDGSERLIPGFLDFVSSWVSPEGGAVHLSGISNGGISAFRVATENPDRFASVTVFPGFPRSDADVGALETLTSIPVNLFVGERDTGWVDPMTDAAERLTELGGDVTFEVFPDEGHLIGVLTDGVRIFDELDAAR